MKRIFTIFILAACTVSQAPAQINATLAAKFGIEGDIQSDFHLNNSLPNPLGTHDWFQKTNGPGLGIVDTIGSNTAYNLLSTGQNYSFDKTMAFPRYSTQDNLLLLDTRYARDYFGLSNSPAHNRDKTLFQSGNKNGDNPANWTLSAGGGQAIDKNDLLDIYIHLRRNGTSINRSNPSNLFLIMAASTFANDGDRYLDFELFREKAALDSSSFKFTNTGPAATGGHSIWTFDPDGSIQQIGDMMVSFSFNASQVTEISVWIWVPYTTSIITNPAGFDFVAGQFSGQLVNGVQYGYARITGNPGSPMNMSGTVNSSITPAAPWGTNSKSLGSNSNNYFSANYDAGQFAEVAIDLTNLGVDPVLTGSASSCNPPFTRVIAKSRSSSSINSELKDFAGPYEFLDAPQVNPAIANPSRLTCAQPSTVLSPQTYLSGVYYNWSTPDGHLLSYPDSGFARIDKAGTYILKSSIIQGCDLNADTVVVEEDYFQPTASIVESGPLYQNVPATLYGGDVASSNDPSHYGGSQGLSWSWTGPSGFISSLQNISAAEAGAYQLVVTETRNGCKDTATHMLRSFVALPMDLINFAGNLENNRVVLNWTVAENEDSGYFEVQKSADGINFSSKERIKATNRSGVEYYVYRETSELSLPAYYRLQIVTRNNFISQSKVIRMAPGFMSVNAIKLLQNPVKNSLVLSYTTKRKNNINIAIYSMAGTKILSIQNQCSKGENLIQLNAANLLKGCYVVEIVNYNDRSMERFIKD